jgi:pimeloyl-ACP methyl ester carboxylesterase
MRNRAHLAARPLLSMIKVALIHSQNLIGSPDPLDAAPSRFATLDGAKVHYRSLGDAASRTAVVFIHGWSCDLTSWRQQVPAFEGKARILLVDLPGHGKSDRPTVDYTMERFARAVDAVLTEAGVERALLVGHSMGTPVARQFWRLFPKKTLGLVSVDGALRTYFKDPAQVEKFAAMFSGPDFARALDGFLGATFAPSTSESVKADVRRMAAGATQSVAVSAMRGQFDPAIWNDDPIGIPLQVIVAKSQTWNADYFAYVKTLNRSAEIHEIPDAGHFVMMEKPAEVNTLLLAFASKTGMIPKP